MRPLEAGLRDGHYKRSPLYPNWDTSNLSVKCEKSQTKRQIFYSWTFSHLHCIHSFVLFASKDASENNMLMENQQKEESVPIAFLCMPKQGVMITNRHIAILQLTPLNRATLLAGTSRNIYPLAAVQGCLATTFHCSFHLWQQII